MNYGDLVKIAGTMPCFDLALLTQAFEEVLREARRLAQHGVLPAELERANLICTIPTSEVYPILNLSHAVGILCYELAGLPRGTYLLAGPVEMESLYRHIDAFLDRIEHPDFKRENTLTLIRRVLGRTKLTTREVSTLHGLMRRAEWHLENKE